MRQASKCVLDSAEQTVLDIEQPTGNQRRFGSRRLLPVPLGFLDLCFVRGRPLVTISQLWAVHLA
jgi:hypothetical protein